MELLVELVFRGIIVKFFGLNARYYFFKLLGVEKSKKYLSGDTENEIGFFSQGFINAIIGLILVASLSYGIGYILYSICPTCI